MKKRSAKTKNAGSRTPGESRCSFCGRKLSEVTHLIGEGKARICNHCVLDLHATIHSPEPN